MLSVDRNVSFVLNISYYINMSIIHACTFINVIKIYLNYHLKNDVCLLTVYINTLNANTCTCAFLCTFNFNYIVTIDFT